MGLHWGFTFDLLGRTGRAIDILIWDELDDAELSGARAAMAGAAVDEDLRSQAAARRSEKMQAIGSQATFFSGLARIDHEFRSVRVAVTPQDFVLLDEWTSLDPDTELARFPRKRHRGRGNRGRARQRGRRPAHRPDP
jgi:hypothetical protein